MEISWDNGLVLFAMLTPIVPLFLLIFIKTTIPRIIYRILVICLFISLISDWLSFCLAMNGIYNTPVIHIYTVAIGSAWFLFYREIFENVKAKAVCLFAIIGLLAVFICESILFEKIYNTPNIFAYGYISIFLVFLSLLFFFLRLDTIQRKSEIFDYLFWINCAVLIYFGSTFVLTLFEDLINDYEASLQQSLWRIQLIATILYSFIIAKGVWTARKV